MKSSNINMKIKGNLKLSCLTNFGQMSKLFTTKSYDISDYLRKITKISELSEADLKEFCQLVLLSDEELATRQKIRSLFEEILRHKTFNTKVFLFGSSENGVGFCDCDCDVYIQMLDKSDCPVSIVGPNLKDKLKQFSDIFSGMLPTLYRGILINAKTCPIIKLIPQLKLKTKATETKSDVMSFDLNMTHAIGVFNSVFIKILVDQEPKIRLLIVVLKFWAKANTVISQLGFNSYAFVMLVLFFLQNCERPLLSGSMETLRQLSDQYRNTVADNQYRAIITHQCRTLVNQPAIAIADVFELIQQFFTFYSKFDFYNYVICPHVGAAIRKDQYEQIIAALDRKSLQSKFTFSSIISMVDPFELNRNITAQVKVFKFDIFITQCKRYSRMDKSFFQNGANFRLLISGPSKNGSKLDHDPSKSLPKQLLLDPTVCFIQNFLNQHFKCFGAIFESLNPSQLTQLLVIDYLQTFVDSFAEFLSKNQRHGNVIIKMTKRSVMKNNLLNLSGEELRDFPGDSFTVDLALVTLSMAQVDKFESTNAPAKKVQKNWWNSTSDDLAAAIGFDSAETKSEHTVSSQNGDPALGSVSSSSSSSSSSVSSRAKKLVFIPINVIIQCIFRSEHFFYLGYQIDNPVGKVPIRKLFNQLRTQLCTCDSIRDVGKCTNLSQ